jgi:hypothetical protein
MQFSRSHIAINRLHMLSCIDRNRAAAIYIKLTLCSWKPSTVPVGNSPSARLHC